MGAGRLVADLPTLLGALLGLLIFAIFRFKGGRWQRGQIC